MMKHAKGADKPASTGVEKKEWQPPTVKQIRDFGKLFAKEIEKEKKKKGLSLRERMMKPKMPDWDSSWCIIPGPLPKPPRLIDHRQDPWHVPYEETSTDFPWDKNYKHQWMFKRDVDEYDDEGFRIIIHPGEIKAIPFDHRKNNVVKIYKYKVFGDKVPENTVLFSGAAKYIEQSKGTYPYMWVMMDLFDKYRPREVQTSLIFDPRGRPSFKVDGDVPIEVRGSWFNGGFHSDDEDEVEPNFDEEEEKKIVFEDEPEQNFSPLSPVPFQGPPLDPALAAYLNQ